MNRRDRRNQLEVPISKMPSTKKQNASLSPSVLPNKKQINSRVTENATPELTNESSSSSDATPGPSRSEPTIQSQAPNETTQPSLSEASTEQPIPNKNYPQIMAIFDGNSYFPCKINHLAKINNKICGYIEYEPFYLSEEFLNSLIESKLPMKPENLDIAFEIASTENSYRKKEPNKRGKRVFKCPYCKMVGTEGNKHSIIRHINQRKKDGKVLAPACNERRKKEPKVGKEWPKAELSPERVYPWSL